MLFLFWLSLTKSTIERGKKFLGRVPNAILAALIFMLLVLCLISAWDPIVRCSRLSTFVVSRVHLQIGAAYGVIYVVFNLLFAVFFLVYGMRVRRLLQKLSPDSSKPSGAGSKPPSTNGQQQQQQPTTAQVQAQPQTQQTQPTPHHAKPPNTVKHKQKRNDLRRVRKITVLSILGSGVSFIQV